jgi:hypothetical protein
LFHSDERGPLPVPSFDGARYFVTFVEDVSRFRFTFLLGEKSAQLETFKKLRSMAEKQYEGQVKVLRADNGGEYVSQASKEFFEKEGLVLETTVPYCSAQNGVAERSHLTLMDMARSMLDHANLPAQYWGAAVLYASEITNVMPHPDRSQKKTTHEFLRGAKPDLSQFKVFGCDAYALLDRPNQPGSDRDEWQRQRRARRNKLQDRSKRMIFMGLVSDQKVWKLQDPVSKACSVYRHVIFHESSFTRTSDHAPPCTVVGDLLLRESEPAAGRHAAPAAEPALDHADIVPLFDNHFNQKCKLAQLVGGLPTHIPTRPHNHAIPLLQHGKVDCPSFSSE